MWGAIVTTGASEAIVVRFARHGARDGVVLSKDREYQVSVDDGPWEPIRSPWDEDELAGLVEVLRNTDPENKPDIAWVAQIGRRLGEAMSGASTLAGRLQSAAGTRTVVFWQLDYPELARLPWELACWWSAPHHHILLDPDVTFVRTVPLYRPREPVGWPTGVNDEIRLLFAWGETPGATVPHDAHHGELERICADNGIDYFSREIRAAGDLAKLVAEQQFDFVHVLAHGTRTDDGDWGLRLGDEDARGEQLARALQAGESTPALVSVAACDSANEPADSFGSVAYHLHAHGIPMVLGSQFRLRKNVSSTSAGRMYAAILRGDHPLLALSEIRRQLSPDNNEAWSNDVLYMNYSLATLDHGASVGRQQGALRRARTIARSLEDTHTGTADTDGHLAALQAQVEALEELAAAQFDLPETLGLLGSLTRRMAHLRSVPPDDEDLREARDHYLTGLRADANSLYCGVNALHLSVILGDEATIAELLPIVRFVADSQIDSGDHWTSASAGEVAVYDGDAETAQLRYREFVRGIRRAVPSTRMQAEQISSAARQLRHIVDALIEDESAHDERSAAIITSATTALAVLENARRKLR